LDDDRVFNAGRRLTVDRGSAGAQETEVEFFRRQHRRAVIKLRGVDSISEAEKLRGAELRIPVSEVAPLEDGSFYTFQLKGCRVYSGDEFLGTVTDVLDSGGTEILKVEHEAKEILIPFAEAYLKKIDIAGRRIDVDLPEGLQDLNR